MICDHLVYNLDIVSATSAEFLQTLRAHGFTHVNLQWYRGTSQMPGSRCRGIYIARGAMADAKTGEYLAM